MNKKIKHLPKPALLTDEESALFRSSIDHVRPLVHDKHHYNKEKSQPNKCPSTEKRNDQSFVSTIDNKAIIPITGEVIITFQRSGIQHRVMKKLKQGQIPIEATLDLHQKTTLEAEQETKHFLERSAAQRKRCVCIIHGKGKNHTEKKAILKSLLNVYLKTQPKVLAFHSAQPKDGGSGALYLLLKRRG